MQGREGSLYKVLLCNIWLDVVKLFSSPICAVTMQGRAGSLLHSIVARYIARCSKANVVRCPVKVFSHYVLCSFLLFWGVLVYGNGKGFQVLWV